MKEFIKYRATKCVGPLIFLTLSALVMYVLPLIIQDFSFWNERGWALQLIDQRLRISYSNLQLVQIIVFLAVAAIGMPVWAMNYRMNTRSCDMYYSLPITRRKLFAINFLLGFAVITAAYTIAFFLGFFVALGRIDHIIHVHYLWLYLALIIPTFSVYALSTFFFTRATCTRDGVVFILMSILPAAFITQAIANAANFFGYVGRMIYTDAFFPFSTITWIIDSFTHIVNLGTTKALDLETISFAASTVFFTLAATAATVWMFYSEKTAKSENCGQISSSPFGYRSMIPILAISSYLIAAAMDEIILAVPIFGLVFVASYALEALYKRTLKIGWKSFIFLVAYLLGSIAVCAIAHLATD